MNADRSFTGHKLSGKPQGKKNPAESGVGMLGG
jgi:hypothetical protein